MRMRILLSVVVALLTLLSGIVSAQESADWPALTETFTTGDRFVVAYPEGWRVVENSGIVAVVSDLNVLSDAPGADDLRLFFSGFNAFTTPFLGADATPRDVLARFVPLDDIPVTPQDFSVNDLPAVSLSFDDGETAQTVVAWRVRADAFAFLTATGATGAGEAVQDFARRFAAEVRYDAPPIEALEPPQRDLSQTFSEQGLPFSVAYPEGWTVNANRSGAVFSSLPDIPEGIPGSDDYRVSVTAGAVAGLRNEQGAFVPGQVLLTFLGRSNLPYGPVETVSIDGRLAVRVTIDDEVGSAMAVLALLDEEHFAFVNALSGAGTFDELEALTVAMIRSLRYDDQPISADDFTISADPDALGERYTQGLFTLAYPADWHIIDEARNSVTFSNAPAADVNPARPTAGQVVVTVSSIRASSVEVLGGEATLPDAVDFVANAGDLPITVLYEFTLNERAAARANLRADTYAGALMAVFGQGDQFLMLSARTPLGEFDASTEAILHQMLASLRPVDD